MPAMLAEHLPKQQVCGHLADKIFAETQSVRTPGSQETCRNSKCTGGCFFTKSGKISYRPLGPPPPLFRTHRNVFPSYRPAPPPSKRKGKDRRNHHWRPSFLAKWWWGVRRSLVHNILLSKGWGGVGNSGFGAHFPCLEACYLLE